MLSFVKRQGIRYFEFDKPLPQLASPALAFPVLGELPPLISAAAICVIALGVIFAAANGQSMKPKQDKP